VSLTCGDVEGKDATVLPLGPGDLIGAMEGSEDLDYSQNIAALKSTVLCRMTQQRMESLLNRYPELGYRTTKFSRCRSAGLTVYPRRPRPSVGSSREMVSKVMGDYREKSLIRSSRRQIEVVDRDELRKITASDVE